MIMQSPPSEVGVIVIMGNDFIDNKWKPVMEFPMNVYAHLELLERAIRFKYQRASLLLFGPFDRLSALHALINRVLNLPLLNE